jgi:UDP-glucose 4-epimerase
LNIFITGGAGFIGSNLADRLSSQEGNQITIYDNYSTGFEEYLVKARSNGVTIIKGDLLDEKSLCSAMEGHEFVFHLAANADIRFGLEDPRRDLEQNTIATFNVLEAMRQNGISKIAFSSTGPVYGEPKVFPTPEDCPFPVQTSLYASSKLAGEALISSYCEGFGFTSYIFRFVSILGYRYPHGHVFDFYRQLLEHPDKLHILGNGKQRKSYLHIEDCLDAILTIIAKADEKVNIYNLGTDEYCEVNQSVAWICEYLGLNPILSYSGGERGWIGDNPFVFLDCSKAKALGWRAKHSIKASIISTLQFLEENKWLLERR